MRSLRIDFKVLLLVDKSMNNMELKYIYDLLVETKWSSEMFRGQSAGRTSS